MRISNPPPTAQLHTRLPCKAPLTLLSPFWSSDALRCHRGWHLTAVQPPPGYGDTVPTYCPGWDAGAFRTEVASASFSAGFALLLEPALLPVFHTPPPPIPDPWVKAEKRLLKTGTAAPSPFQAVVSEIPFSLPVLLKNQ